MKWEKVTEYKCRFAHVAGHTDLSSSHGGWFVSCGQDDDIRIYTNFDDDAESHTVGDGAVCAVEAHGDRIAAACETKVLLFPFNQVSNKTLILTFVADCHHIAFMNKDTIFAGGSDFQLKKVCIDKDGNPTEQKTFEGHNAPILSIACDPKQQYVATSSCDGTVKIWEADSTRLVTTLKEMCASCTEFESSKSLCRLTWYPNDGQYLVIPKRMKLNFFERKQWTVVREVEHSEISADISVVEFSSQDDLLAAGCVDGSVFLIHLTLPINPSSRVAFHKLYEYTKSFPVCAIAWDPTPPKDGHHNLFYTNKKGNLFKVGVQCKISASENTEPSNTDAAIDFDDDICDDGDIWDNIDKMETTQLDFEDSRDGGKEYQQNENSADGSRAPTVQSTAPSGTDVQTFAPAITQKPFQPGSTPNTLDRFFMAWNKIGIVECLGDEGETWSVETSFHDANVGPQSHFSFQCKPMCADLTASTLAIVTEDNTLNVYNLNAAQTREWQIEMNDKEIMQCVSVNDVQVIVASSNAMVRTFSLYGTQLDIISVPGLPVCTIAEFTRSIVVYWSPGYPEVLQLSYLSLNDGHDSFSSHMVVSPGATLVWLGFVAPNSDKNAALVSVESKGLVRQAKIGVAKTWHVIGNLRSYCHGERENIWTISVEQRHDESLSTLYGIRCKGGMYPTTIPRPVAINFPLKAPLCKTKLMEKEVEVFEYRKRILTSNIDKDVELLQLFVAAVNEGRMEQAWSFAVMFRKEESLQAATRLAHKKGCNTLVSWLQETDIQGFPSDSGNDVHSDQGSPVRGDSCDDHNRDTLVQSSNSYRSPAEESEGDVRSGDTEEDAKDESESVADETSFFSTMDTQYSATSSQIRDKTWKKANPFGVKSGSSEKKDATSSKGSTVFDSFIRKDPHSVTSKGGLHFGQTKSRVGLVQEKAKKSNPRKRKPNTLNGLLSKKVNRPNSEVKDSDEREKNGEINNCVELQKSDEEKASKKLKLAEKMKQFQHQ